MISLHLTNEGRIDARTTQARYDHHVMGRWLGATQYWSWDDGDAIVVVTNHIHEPLECHVAIRNGDTVKVVRASGLTAAMECVGLNPKDFQVC